jgi:adenylate kinase
MGATTENLNGFEQHFGEKVKKFGLVETLRTLKDFFVKNKDKLRKKVMNNDQLIQSLLVCCIV